MSSSNADRPNREFSSLDLLAVVRELRRLDRPRVDKVFDRVGGGILLTLRLQGEGRRELEVVPGRFVALGPAGGERSEELSPFAQELRRLLAGAVVLQVTEP